MIVPIGTWVKVNGLHGHVCGTSQSVTNPETKTIKVCFKKHEPRMAFDDLHTEFASPFDGIVFLGHLIPEPFEPHYLPPCTCSPCELHDE